MALTQGACPSCGAPIAFGVGASAAQVCKYCKAVVVRTDRDFANAGRVADLAPTASLVAVDDTGSVSGRAMRVLGRVQYDHGAGPWDEWYVVYQDGAWGWLAYAQGNWYATSEVALTSAVPPWGSYGPQFDVNLGEHGVWRVRERKRGRVVSAEGELPAPVLPQQDHYYVDIAAPRDGFGTIDFGVGDQAPRLFLGVQIAEGQVQIRPASERPVTETATTSLTCPSCGGNVPALAPNRSERLGCPYCGVVSDIPTRRALAQQQAARATPDIPLGTRGTFEGAAYVVCGYVERSASIEGESFGWQEYLLFSEGTGFRWLVNDEGAWLWVSAANPAEVDLRALPARVTWQGKAYSLRNHNAARVDYVLGELYWRVEVGETVDACDYVHGNDVLSSEASADEINWSCSRPVAWAQLAAAFGLPAQPAGVRVTSAVGTGASGSSGSSAVAPTTVKATIWIVIALFVFVCFLLIECNDCASNGSGSSGGVFYGGGTTYGGSTRGGK